MGQSNRETPTFRVEVFLTEGAPDQASVGRLLKFSQPVQRQTRLGDPSPEELVACACQIYESRLKRTGFFAQSLFGEPVWDMLLALYCLSARGKALSVSGLGYASHVPQTTALRWSQMLEERNLIVRTKDTSDARRFHITLSEDGKRLMDKYLHSLTPMES